MADIDIDAVDIHSPIDALFYHMLGACRDKHVAVKKYVRLISFNKILIVQEQSTRVAQVPDGGNEMERKNVSAECIRILEIKKAANFQIPNRIDQVCDFYRSSTTGVRQYS